jgi:O-antigen ligase
LVAFLLVYKAIQTEADVKKIYVALLWWGIILSLMELYQLFNYGGLTLGMINVFLQKNLVATSWGRSNYLAAFDVLLIPLTLAVFFTKTSRPLRYLNIVALALMTTALIISLSRGGLAACLVAVSIVLTRYLRLKTLLPILAIILVLGFIVFLNPLTFVLLERASEFERSASFYSRVGTWEEAWQIFQMHPIFGVGINNLGYHTLFVTAGGLNAHNIVLGLLSETGIVGLILFIVLMLRTFHSVLQAWLSAKTPFLKSLSWGIIGLLIGALFHAMLEPNFEGYQFSVMVWTCLGMAAKLPYLVFDEPPSKTDLQRTTCKGSSEWTFRDLRTI